MEGFSLKRLTLVILVLTAILASTPTLAQSYKIDTSHSALDFSIRHLVSKTTGTFGAFSGTIMYDANHPEKSQFLGTIDVSSIDTQNSRRDGHLQSGDFFDVATYPTITFASTQVEKTDDGRLQVTGDLAMHGVTKSVMIPVEILGTGTHPMSGKKQIGLAGELTIKASDFGINSWENFVAILGDEIDIRILVEANAG
jgi:polyisoprenoid-binding protein YceI